MAYNPETRKWEVPDGLEEIPVNTTAALASFIGNTDYPHMTMLLHLISQSGGTQLEKLQTAFPVECAITGIWRQADNWTFGKLADVLNSIADLAS